MIYDSCPQDDEEDERRVSWDDYLCDECKKCEYRKNCTRTNIKKHDGRCWKDDTKEEEARLIIDKAKVVDCVLDAMSGVMNKYNRPMTQEEIGTMFLHYLDKCVLKGKNWMV